MSPPSRNQVMNMPKPRPPSPHSLRCSLSSAWRHRAAAKPTSVTTTNMMMTMVSATALPLMSVRLPLVIVRGLTVGPVTPLRQPAQQEGGGGQDRDDRHPYELVPVEEREVPERRGEVVVERHPQRADQCGRQQDRDHDPGADVLARGADRKSTRLNSSHPSISYAVFCLKKKKKTRASIIFVKEEKENDDLQKH